MLYFLFASMCPSSCIPSIPIRDTVYMPAIRKGFCSCAMASGEPDLIRPLKKTMATVATKKIAGSDRQNLLLGFCLGILATVITIPLSTENLTVARVGISRETYLDLFAAATIPTLFSSFSSRGNLSLTSDSAIRNSTWSS